MASNKTAQDGFFAQLGQTFAPPPWSLLEAGLAFVVLLIGLLFIATVIAFALSPDSTSLTAQGQVIGWTIGLAIVAAFVLIRWRSVPEKFAALRISGETAQSPYSPILVFIIGVGTGLTANLCAALGSNGNFETIAPLQGLYTDFAITPLVTAILFAVLIQPFAESLIFFGVLQPRLRATLGAYPGLIVTAALYAGVHYFIYGERPGVVVNPFWYGLIAPFICGLLFGMVRVWMRSTRAVIIANIGAGIIAILIMLTV
jgi:membrane protease YdiL (CAAX protease family)